MVFELELTHADASTLIEALTDYRKKALENINAIRIAESQSPELYERFTQKFESAKYLTHKIGTLVKK
jgi:hypothetical protein